MRKPLNRSSGNGAKYPLSGWTFFSGTSMRSLRLNAEDKVRH
jgi:hypothetical protein